MLFRLFGSFLHKSTSHSVASCGLLLGAQPMGCALDILPAKFTKLYGIATLVTAAICISTPFINADFTPYAILALLYGAVLTPLYEDVLFRGWIWEAVRERGDAAAYRISTLLFAFWHLGYIDTILWRTSLFFEDANIPEIMFWKAIIGLVYGIILGAVRYRTRNVYSSMLLHCVMNTIGG